MARRLLKFATSSFDSPLAGARDLFRWLKSPGEQGELWRDYRHTWKEAAFLREHSFHPQPQKTVLIAAVDSPFYEVKQMSMLALGLKLVGWRPVALINSRDVRWAHRYFRAYGLEEFVYWTDFSLDAPERAECARDAAGFFGTPPSFQSVKNWSYRECWVGPQILSSISRGTLRGAP